MKKFISILTGLFLFSVIAFAQTREVTGVVYADQVLDGNELIGASVVEKGTNNGIATDFDGKFRLRVKPDAILVVSFVGYETKEIPVEDNTSFNIVLKEYHQMLDEAIITAPKDDDDD